MEYGLLFAGILTFLAGLSLLGFAITWLVLKLNKSKHVKVGRLGTLISVGVFIVAFASARGIANGLEAEKRREAAYEKKMKKRYANELQKAAYSVAKYGYDVQGSSYTYAKNVEDEWSSWIDNDGGTDLQTIIDGIPKKYPSQFSDAEADVSKLDSASDKYEVVYNKIPAKYLTAAEKSQYKKTTSFAKKADKLAKDVMFPSGSYVKWEDDVQDEFDDVTDSPTYEVGEFISEYK